MQPTEIQQAAEKGFWYYQGQNLQDSLAVACYAFVKAVFFGLLPTSLVCVVVYFVSSFFMKLIHEKAIVIVAFAAFGFFLGIFTASSRVSVMAVVLPLIISFISGYIAYSFQSPDGLINKEIVPAALVALILSATFGGFYGGEIRGQSQSESVKTP